MINYLSHFRSIYEPIPLKRKITNSLLTVLIGVLLGIVSKWFDISSEFFGNVFSQMSIWVFLATIISVFSNTPKRASLNVFLFFAGMIVSYYITAHITESVYSWSFIKGWCVVTVLSPLFAYFTWYAKGKGWLSNVLSCGIILFMAVSAIFLFDRIRITDIAIIILTAVILFKKGVAHS